MTQNGYSPLLWENQLLAKLTQAKERRQELEAELQHWAEYEKAVEVLLRLEREHRGLKIAPGHIIDSSASLRENLVRFASANGGIFSTKDVIPLLVKAGAFDYPQQARDNVYSVLSRSKEFHRERPGVWRLMSETNQASLPMKTADKTRNPQKRSGNSGLADRVQQILVEHPDYNRLQVRDLLLSQGWDFRDKNPTFAVAMAFAVIAKRRKAQASSKDGRFPATTISVPSPL